MRLSLSFLGPFQATLNSSPVKGFESDKVRALLAYLAVEAEQPHRRDSLAALLWPEQPQDVALKNLRHVLYKLRQVLGEASEADRVSQVEQPPYLLVTTQTVQFNTASDFQLDVTEFTRLIADCETHNHRRLEICGSCNRRLERAAELHRGEFLAGFALADSTEFDEWLLLTREAMHQKTTYALVHLAAYCEAHSDYPSAVSYARKQLELEPWNEEAHRHLMRLLWITKQRSAALAQYQACRRILSQELGIEPGSETKALYSRILAGEYGESNAPNEGADERARHNLPVHVTPFIGREQELSRIAERLESQNRRLLTLVGPGGIGKSRLALKAATDHAGTFESGVYFVPMAPVTSPDLVISSIAQALSLHFAGKEDEEWQLLHYLADKEMLLVIDNFEHLLAGVGIIKKIIERAPRVSLLVTSRERLNLQAESIIDISGLLFPSAPSSELPIAMPVEQASSYPSVQLFLERAQSRQEDFCLTAATAPAVLQICRIVGGLPLAIELAAAHVLDFSCAEIARAIQANLDFLATDLRDVPLSHSSLRATFNYSWSLLTEDERAAFRALSVFRGGWDSEVAAQVAGASRPLLRSLADKSLIRRAEQEDRIRHDIHEVLRQYAAEELDAIPTEKVQVVERHAQYYLEVAEKAEPNLRGAEQEVWLHLLEQEHANLQAAIKWAMESGQREVGLRLVGALWQFWVMHAHYATGRTLLSSFNQQAAEPTPVWAKALFGAGKLAMQQGDQVAAHRLMEESKALYEQLGDDAAVRQTIIEQARAYIRQGNYALGEQLAGQALQMARAADDRQAMASALTHLGSTAVNQGNFATARRLYTECLTVQRSMEDKWGIAWTLTNLGVLSQYEGDSGAGGKLFEESLAIRSEIGDKWGIATCLNLIGTIAIEEGNYNEARGYIIQALELRRDFGDLWAITESYIYYGLLEYSEHNFEQAIEKWGRALSLAYAQQNHFLSAYCLTGLAIATLKTGHIPQAANMLGAAASLVGSLNVRLSPSFQKLCDEGVSSGQTQLGDAEWSVAWSEGTNMTLDAVYEVARTLYYAAW